MSEDRNGVERRVTILFHILYNSNIDIRTIFTRIVLNIIQAHAETSISPISFSLYGMVGLILNITRYREFTDTYVYIVLFHFIPELYS